MLSNLLKRCAPLIMAVVTPAATAAEITIDSGRLSGAPSPYGPTITTFKGIPFAQPPLAELRWRAPVSPRSWQGTRNATSPGTPCWQPQVPETSIYSRGPIETGEDCLYLNVWSELTEDPPTAADTSRAVMVWFHGGGNTTGHGSSLIFDGTRLAEKGVVVVTANYRMGPFGFFAHPGLSAESEHGTSGNYGLMDQIAVLEWVQRNIAAFGGDPQRVVVFGQSAGSIDICLLMSSPLTSGLISGAIGHSGGCMKTSTTLSEAEADGEKIAAAFDGAAHDRPHPAALAREIAGLRAIAPQAFVETASSTGVPLSRTIVDGWVVPEPPRARFLSGRHTQVPLIVGDMADEFRGLGATMPEFSPADYQAQVQQNFPAIADQVLDAYADIAGQSPREAYRKISTHSFFTWESRTWAGLVADSGQRSFVYHFTHPTAVFSLYVPERPEFDDPNPPRGLGAYHSGDLAYHFNNTGVVGLGWTEWDHQIADIISSYWVNFANTGNPNGPGLPAWPSFDENRDNVQLFGTEVVNNRHPQLENLILFDQAYPAPLSD